MLHAQRDSYFLFFFTFMHIIKKKNKREHLTHETQTIQNTLKKEQKQNKD